MERPAHHTKRGFRNLHLDERMAKKSMLSVLKMRFSSNWANHHSLKAQVPTVEPDLERIMAPNQPQITWLGHSTFLIQINGLNCLTDPVLSQRASPVQWAGPKRYTEPALEAQQLPPIDVILISHNHYDHLDLTTLKNIKGSPIVLAPLGNRAVLAEAGLEQIVELDWWASHQLNDCTFTATPVQHWSARGLNDRFRSLWCGWVMNTPVTRIYFAGDTGYNDTDFVETGRRFGPFDLALLPIGAYEPRWFMKPMHVNPEEAVQIHIDIRAKQSLAMHWGTFPLTAERPGEPPRRLRQALSQRGLPPETFRAIPIGSTVAIAEGDAADAS